MSSLPDRSTSSAPARKKRIGRVLAALDSLAEATRDASSPEHAMQHAARVLGTSLKADRAGYGTIDPEDGLLHLGPDWAAVEPNTEPRRIDLRDYGNFAGDLEAGVAVVVPDVASDARTMARAGMLQAGGASAFMSIPLMEAGLLRGVLFITRERPYAWTDADCALAREVAERTRGAWERLRGIQALRDSEAKFRTIANAMPQMVWSTLADGYHDYYNQQWYDYTGMPSGSTDGAGWNGMFHPEDRDRAWAAWRHSLASGATYEIQYRLRHHSGEYRWVLGRALPVRDERGQVTRWMGTCTDIHRQKLAEDELREGARRKDEFLAMLAHELRNPLAPISTAAQLLRMPGVSPQHVRQASDIIARQARHMTDLVDDLLDVSRVTRGLVTLDMAPQDLKAIVHGAVEQAGPLVAARQHQLSVQLADAPASVLGDRTRLVQVIANVLNNAAKYTPPGGNIALELALEDGRAVLTVRDDGVGMPADLLPHVFELFVQGERMPDRSQGGMGLGLALVRSLTELHGGSVTAQSAGTGQGSLLTIVLPLLPDNAMALPVAESAAATGTAASLAVMIVDDNADAADSLATLLRALGHQVDVVRDAEGALRRHRQAPARVYILDIGLPGMDGHALAAHLRQSPAGKEAVLIALTGYGQQRDRARSQAAGFDHHFVKPVDPKRLFDVLDRLPALPG